MSASYFLCGTPRTGSTLLCSLLSSTDCLGRPESYFREEDEVAWARRFGLATDGPRVRDYAAYVRAVQRAGSTANAVFAARIMWGSLERLLDGLGTRAGDSCLDVLERAFGPLRFAYLTRQDVIAQAVSWCRAEETGYWQQGDIPGRDPELHLDQMTRLVGTIRDHNAAWNEWFGRAGVQPHSVTYEQVTKNARVVVEEIAGHVGVEIPARWRPTSPHRKQADAINARWADALRAALER